MKWFNLNLTYIRLIYSETNFSNFYYKTNTYLNFQKKNLCLTIYCKKTVDSHYNKVAADIAIKFSLNDIKYLSI